jgi:2-(1,2-epoxy-1,2-dihydrophenyl)acetyl-CoA isomerase
MSSAFETLLVATGDGVLTITLNRPESYNAFDARMCVELSTVLKAAARDEAVRCLVITGAGKAFGSGQDLQEIRGKYESVPPGGDLDFGSHLRTRYNPILARLRTLEKPVIASVNGVAAGAGASLAFACDLRIAAANAAFILSFVNVGLVPDCASTLTLVQHVGYARAAELCFLGDKLSAEEAQRWGLVNRVVAAEELAAATRDLALRLANLPTRAIGLTKRALNKAWTATLDEQLETEAFLQQTAGNTADHREGVMAFVEKRKARYVGK